jgi:hypothetical protein
VLKWFVFLVFATAILMFVVAISTGDVEAAGTFVPWILLILDAASKPPRSHPVIARWYMSGYVQGR